MGDGDTVGVVVGVFDRCGVGFGSGVATCVVRSGSKRGGDITVVDVVINAGDGDGLGCIPVGGCEGKCVGA